MALIPEWFRTEILQEKLDAKGVLVENSSVAESVKFALLFEFDGILMQSGTSFIIAVLHDRLLNLKQKKIQLNRNGNLVYYGRSTV